MKKGIMSAKGGERNYSIAVVSLGCSKNLVNTEQMMFLLQQAGYTVTGDTDAADAVIINTCGFIESAKTEAIETIIEFGKAKYKSKTGKIIVAGCLAQRYKQEIFEQMPEVDALVGTGSFDDITEVVDRVLKSGERPAVFGNINAPVSETCRVHTTSPSWTYLKIAEGCDNKCAYCVIPEIRGGYRSRPVEKIISEATDLAAVGIKELILVAQDVTGYGHDIYGENRLSDLLVRLCKIDKLEWIRLHYLYPTEIDDKLIDVIAENDKIVKYLDIPVQHVNDGILRQMNRRGGAKEIRSLITKLRKEIPGVVFRTSIITGLPGEGEAQFQELCEFLQESKIERAGIFPYSPEEGTAAARLERPDTGIAGRRAEILSGIQSQIMDEYNESRIGSVTKILIEGFDEGRCYGRSFAESPEVDGYIAVEGGGIASNEFAHVLITGIKNGEPVGNAIGIP